MEKLNPAQRLKKILETAKRFDTNTPTREVWSKILCFQENASNSDLYRAMGDMARLPFEVKVALEKLPRKKERYVNSIIVIEKIINDSFNSMSIPWVNYINQVMQPHLDILELCSEDLNDISFEGQPKESELEEINELLKNLKDKTQKSNIDATLKSLIFHICIELELAMFKYEMYGPDAMAEVRNSVLGKVILNHAIFKENKESEWYSDFISVIDRINNLVEFAKNSKEAIAAVAILLLNRNT